MIKLIIFDLDGVFLSSKHLHFLATQEALKSFGYSYSEEEDNSFGTIPTREKLQRLAFSGKVREVDIDNIWKMKGEKFPYIFKESLSINESLLLPKKAALDMFEYLRECFPDIKIAIASNARKEYINSVLGVLPIGNYIDKIFSSEILQKGKPNPQLYLVTMAAFGISPKETLIVEDSLDGQKAAYLSGAHVFGVKDHLTWTFNFLEHLSSIDAKSLRDAPYYNHQLTVVIPMAGLGSRFPLDIYKDPKPFIDVAGKPMIQRVVDNLNIKAKYVFITQKKHMENDLYRYILNNSVKDCEKYIITIDGITQGAAETVLRGWTHFMNDDPLLIVNSDNLIKWNSGEWMHKAMNDASNGCIFTFEAPDQNPKWSYASINNSGFITNVAEKNPISTHATTGHYLWKRGVDFYMATTSMIKENFRVNNEFYVAPTYNYAIKNGLNYKIYPVQEFWGIGDPSSLNSFLDKCKEIDLIS